MRKTGGKLTRENAKLKSVMKAYVGAPQRFLLTRIGMAQKSNGNTERKPDLLSLGELADDLLVGQAEVFEILGMMGIVCKDFIRDFNAG